MFTFGQTVVVKSIPTKKKANFVKVLTPSFFVIWDGIADLKPDHTRKLQLMFVSCLTASRESKLFFDKPN